MRSAIALVHVQINHGHLQGLRAAWVGLGPFRLHATRRHCHIVEHAKATAFAGVGVVCSPRQVARQAVAQGRAGRSQRSPHRAARALGHGLTPGETDFPLRSGRQRALGNGGDVFRQMHARQFLVFCRGRYMQTGFWQLLGNPVAQQAVLRHGKAMPLGQRQHKFIGVIGIHDVIVATRAFPGGLPLICCIATKNTCNHTIAA